MNYTIEYTKGVGNTLFKHWNPISTREDGIFVDTLDEARKMLCDWIRANVSDEGDYAVESLCEQAMTLDAGDEMRAWEDEGFAHNYTIRIA